ncbi:FecR domain-containing protein [Bradyrhizobium sp. ARR65]|uniref:FecR domain-containing protein n=1 Tax=Bradyrhizobium sp. ARR65 TaxID=1040989 RepID=UPI000462ED09|nr:FecR domain-containing protein [Bradyrhizobium sp. ARR65]
MNYIGKFNATIAPDGQGTASHSYVHVDKVQGHAPPDAIVVPDAHLLFNADFKRSGLDLILSKDDHAFVLHDYFKGEKRAPLASPDGAHLTGDIVNALTGAVELSQAGAPASSGQVIGHVTKLVGSATAIRNGVSIILNMGDNVEKGDVVQSGADSTLGLTFIDGTVFGLSSNARMVLNEMVYDPNGSSNSSLLSLVAGTITFVAGETAKHGDMKVDTPVATMGIRGTAVLVEIDFAVPGQATAPDAKFQVLIEPDGHTGSYILFDKTTLQPIAVVNQAGQQINISNGVVSQTSAPLSEEIQKLITDVFSLKFSANDTNPKTTTAQTDTLNPLLLVGPIIKLASGATATPVFQTVGSDGNSSAQNSNVSNSSIFHIPGPPNVAILDAHGQPTTSFALAERVGQTGDATDSDTISGRVNFADINVGDQPTVKITFSSFSYQNAQHQDVTASLNAQQLADVLATELKLTVVPDPGNQNTGGATFSYSIADKAFDFLAAGETLTLTYRVRVDNNYAPNNEYTTVPIAIRVTGTNDAPVITTGAEKIALSGGTNVPGGTLNDPAKGTLAFTDVDLTDTHTVSVALLNQDLPPGPLDILNKALTASIATDSTGAGAGIIDWQFAALPVYIADFIPKDEVLTLTYAVTVTDSQGATSTQDITITITGTDNAAVVWIHTSGDGSPDNSWNTGRNWETGTAPAANDDVIIITDQLRGLTPSYPVVVDANGANAAVAHSLTMNDFSDGKPELDILSTGELAIGAGGLSVKADAKINNHGTVTVGGEADFLDESSLVNSGTISFASKAEFLDQSVLVNSGSLTLRHGGDFSDTSHITNSEGGTIEVAGGTLSVAADVANSGELTVDAGATLALETAVIDGGTVSVKGTLELQGSGVLQDGTLDNTGRIKVTGIGNALHDEDVTASNTLELMAGAALLLDQGTTIANYIGGAILVGEEETPSAGGTITVGAAASLTLNDATVIGGTVTNQAGGTIDLTGSAALTYGALDNSGQINISGAGNSLDGETVTNTSGTINITGIVTLELGTVVTGGTLTNSGSLHVETSTGATFDGVSVDNTGGTIQVDCESSPPASLILGDGTTIKGGTLTIGDAGTLEISTCAGATLSGMTVNNGYVVQVDTHSVLTLDRTTIKGGTIADDGTIHVVSASAIDNAALNGGYINVDSDVTLTLDDTTVTGASLTIGSGSYVELDNSSIWGGTLSISGTLYNVAGNNTISADITEDGGHIEVTGGALDLKGALSGDVEIAGGSTLELSACNLSAYAQTTVTFETGATGTLILDHSTSFGGTIAGLDDDDTLDLADISYTSDLTVSYANGILSVFAGDIDVANIHLAGDYSGVHWVLGADASGHTMVTEAPGDDLVTTLSASSAAQGAEIDVIGVTDDGGPVTSGLTYSWQISYDGTTYWTEVDTHSYYVPTENDEEKYLRLVTTYVDASTGETEQTVNTLGAVADIAPTLIAPFSFAVDELKIVKNGNQVFDDSFAQAPPTAGTFGSSPVSFLTKGSIWTEGDGQSVMSSTGAVVLPTVDGAQVIARLGTNNEDENVSSGGLKENATFTVSATFDLTVPQYGGQQYGIDLNDSSATHPNDEMVDLYVTGDGRGGVTVKLVEANFSTTTFTTIASQALTAEQLAGNTQIEVDLAHLTVNTSDITGSFELLNEGTQTYAQTFGTTGHIFDNVTYTRADIFAFARTDVAITGQAQEGQTLTANTTTNEDDASIHYQWQHSNDGGYTWTDIGTDSATYLVQESDEGYAIRVKATTFDFIETPASAVSAATAIVTSDADDLQAPAPAIEVGSASVTQENAPLVLNSISVSDPGAGSDPIQVQLSVGHGALALKDSTGLTLSFDAAHDTVAIAGTVADIDAALAKGVIYTPANDFVGHDTLTVAANDEGHNSSGNPEITSEALGLTVTGVPVIETDRFTLTQNEDGTSTISGIQVNDADPSAASRTFTLAVTTGDAPEGSVTPDSGSGSLAQINAALSAITYHPGANPPASDMVNLTVTDGFGAGETVHFVFSENGSGATLQGTAGNDVIFATGGNDSVTGNGGLDQFVFKPTSGLDAVQHTITDFDPNLDTIDLRQFGNSIAVSNLMANATQQGNDTLVTIDPHDSLLLKNVVATSLHTSDFIIAH